MRQAPTAAVILIGNELLSGRTQDTNLAYIGKGLAERGIVLTEARVIPDVEATIIEVVNTLRANVDYVFTTGGIGPTHDDITSLCIARAFGVPLLRHTEAEAILRKHYAGGTVELNAARLKMADTPECATLIENPISGAPGFQIGNVYVMAGVPKIMQAMFDNVLPTLARGKTIQSRTISCLLAEGTIAAGLTEIQGRHSDIAIGSYPFVRGSGFGTNLVSRGTDVAELAAVEAEIRAMVTGLGGEFTEV